MDENLLIYAVNQGSPYHDLARRWTVETLSSGEWVGFTPVVLLAFLRITTRSGIFERHIPDGGATIFSDFQPRRGEGV